MITITPYTFYPLLQRFVTLWRYVQVVSDCLTFLVSMLCCQCWSLMPLSPSASEKASIESFQIIPEAMIEPGRASGEPFRAQHLVIDFTPRPDDTEESRTKCQQFWDAVNSHPDIGGMMAMPEHKTQSKNVTSVPVHKPSSSADNVPAFPALHMIRNLSNRGEKTGPIDAALEAPTCKPKY